MVGHYSHSPKVGFIPYSFHLELFNNLHPSHLGENLMKDFILESQQSRTPKKTTQKYKRTS